MPSSSPTQFPTFGESITIFSESCEATSQIQCLGVVACGSTSVCAWDASVVSIPVSFTVEVDLTEAEVSQ